MKCTDAHLENNWTAVSLPIQEVKVFSVKRHDYYKLTKFVIKIIAISFLEVKQSQSIHRYCQDLILNQECTFLKPCSGISHLWQLVVMPKMISK